jgi:acetyltransferase-like isoleucine patch superfamily enzyme
MKLITKDEIVWKIKLFLRGPLRPVFRFLAFFFYNTHYVEGSAGKLEIGKRVGLANTLCNLSSGNITIGNYCAFGQNVMLITGVHLFKNGKRASLVNGSSEGWGGGEEEVPSSGRDIDIGEGCFIGSGSIISGPVKVGKHSIICAGAVVTKDVESHQIVAGVPAKPIGDTREL